MFIQGALIAPPLCEILPLHDDPDVSWINTVSLRQPALCLSYRQRLLYMLRGHRFSFIVVTIFGAERLLG